MTTGVDRSTSTYDAQNRLLTATKGGTTEFKYDGLNRQVSRKIGAAPPTYNVYDGWNLIAEYAPGATTPSTAYLSGAGDLVKNLTTNRYYYQDASGSTSHLASSTGQLLEWYRYNLQGTPIFYNPSDTQIGASAYGIRHLFTGQQWYSGLGLYDLRNRFYSPDIGRFLQADPIGFNGDASNLYRYCGSNPVTRVDPLGLDQRTIVVGYYGGVMITWGNNGGQSNFGFYGGLAYGASYSYRPSDSGSTSPGAVGGIAERGTLGASKFASVSVNYSGTTRDGNLMLSGSIGEPRILALPGVSTSITMVTFLLPPLASVWVLRCLLVWEELCLVTSRFRSRTCRMETSRLCLAAHSTPSPSNKNSRPLLAHFKILRRH